MKYFPVLKSPALTGRRLLAVSCIVLSVLQPQTALADRALVAIASNFIGCARVLAEAFEANSHHTLKLTFGSTGQLYAQIMHGAPYDLFLAADQGRAAALEESGRTVAGSRFTYALGQLVLAEKPATAATTAMASDLAGLERLRGNDFSRLAMANPALAPYGIAARQTLAKVGLLEQLQDRIVLGENVGQAFAMLATGNVELAFVARSQLIEAPFPLQVWQVPASLYAPIRQDLVLLARGESNAAALAFHQYLRSAAAMDIMARHGYRAAVD